MPALFIANSSGEQREWELTVSEGSMSWSSGSRVEFFCQKSTVGWGCLFFLQTGNLFHANSYFERIATADEKIPYTYIHSFQLAGTN